MHLDAITTALRVASSIGLAATDALVLSNSNRLTLHLLPCDTLAQVAPVPSVAAFEIEIARRLGELDAPVARLDPRAEPRPHPLDGREVTFWTHYTPASPISPEAYADALHRLHRSMREIPVEAPSFRDRVSSARRLLDDPGRTPELPAAHRELLMDVIGHTLSVIGARGGAEQLLHGEPHEGNLLATAHGPLFIDFETCCTGPVEFDIAHAPPAVETHYPGADPAMLRACRMLALALVITWRWDRDDQLPDGRRRGSLWLAELMSLRGGDLTA